MRAGSQAPQGLKTQASLPVAAQPRLSLSPNFHTSRTSRSMAFLKLSAPSRLLVLGFRWAPPEGVKGSSLSQGLGGDSGASLRPVSGRLWGSEIPGDRTQTRWTEMSKASSSRFQEWGLPSRRCPWKMGAVRPPRSCGAAVGRSCGNLGPSLQEPGSGPWHRACRPSGPRALGD